MRSKAIAMRPWIFPLQAAVACTIVTSATEGRADPVADCISANERFLSLRKQGKLLDARRELALCAAASCPEVVHQACRARIPELNAAIPSVVFDVKGAGGHDVTDAKVSVDGVPAGTAGVAAVPVDPGRHTFRFEVSNEPPVDKTLVLREGEKTRRIVVVVDTSTAAPASASRVSRASRLGPVSPEPMAEHAEETRTGNVQGAVGWIIAGAGTVAAGLGGGLAFLAKSSYDGASGCSGTTCTTAQGLDTSNSARDLGNAATVLLIAGGASVVGGVILVLSAPRPSSAGPASPAWQVGVVPGGFVAQGRF